MLRPSDSPWQVRQRGYRQDAPAEGGIADPLGRLEGCTHQYAERRLSHAALAMKSSHNESLSIILSLQKAID